MNRPFYSDYVRHAMRFYARNLEISHFKSDVDKMNWTSCCEIIQTYSNKDRDILIKVYGGFDTLADNVYLVAETNDIDQHYIWDMMKEFERKIAERRKLI